jgi:hypothetical protein
MASMTVLTSACGGEAATSAGSSVSDPNMPGTVSGGAGTSSTAGQPAAGGGDDDRDDLDVGGGAVVVNAGGGPGFMECAGQAQQAQPIGLDMYVVLDRSGSMEEDEIDDDMNPGDCPLSLTGLPGNPSKWCLATHALAKYFASPAAANNRAGLQYFPLEGEDGDDAVCTGGMITQAQVPLSVLPIAAPTDALIQSLDATVPRGNGTPIEAALNGIKTYTAANQDGARVMIGILITDGDPTQCSEDTAQLASILTNHLTTTGLKTYVIGMNGAVDTTLEALAIAGGAPPHMDFCGTVASPCHYYNVGAGDPAAFASALAQIQLSAALPCDFNIPPPPDTQDLDPNLVNVTFTNLGVTNALGRVNDVTACTGDGWYYDNLAAPTKVQLCPTTCTAAEMAGQDAKVDITFGCETIIQ